MSLLSRQRVVSILLYTVISAVVFQVLIVALYSRYNLHPDEFSHNRASTYFQNHLFKLAIDHPAMLKTLIPGWGSSYLFLNDIVYSLAEKATSLLAAFNLEDYSRYRLFNFILLPILLLIFIADKRNGVWFLLALGLTPQVWYIFAYFNGDALSMFSSFLLGYFYITNRVEIESSFWEKSRVSTIMLCFYTLCVLVLFTRLHYAIFVFFVLGLILVANLADKDFKSVINGSIRLLIFFLLVTIPVGIAELKDQIANDFQKSAKIKLVQEENRSPEFKKEYIIASGKNPHRLYLKQTGVPYHELFTEKRWLEISFKSFFGVYGYMNISLSGYFHLITGFIGAGITLIALLVSTIRADLRFRIIVAYFFFAAFLVLVQSSMYSWLFNFQAQGRYMLAIIPMMAVVLALAPSRQKLQPVSIQEYVVLVYLFNSVGFAIFGVLPMIGA